MAEQSRGIGGAAEQPAKTSTFQATKIEIHDDDDDEDSLAEPRHCAYGLRAASSNQETQGANQSETIQVTLNEGYFLAERRALIGAIANARQKLNSMRLFNPAQNEASKQKQDRWDEKEKYTLDSLNELKGNDDKFQWSRPDDGREVWPSKLQYFLAITSYSIGLGNVIRFPILVQKNGGLAFIILFVIMLLLEGIPLFYLELAIGQRMRKASISCWNLISPFAAGIGLASAAVSFIVGLYYNTMVAWTLMYSWSSITAQLRGLPLPFAQCPPTSGELHEETSLIRQKIATNGVIGNISSQTSETATTECQSVGSFQYFWYRQTLDISSNVGEFKSFNWSIAFCLICAWLVSYVCLVKGLSSSKRVVYISSTLPYAILLVLFFKALTLDGMSDGVYYFIAPDWPKLWDPYVWLQAAAQVFFSLGLGFGGLIALSSYNSVNNNCYKDAIKVSVINFATSIFAGLVLFAILGFRANLRYERCQVQRDQQINFYISDYNLKVLEYKDVFFAQKQNDATEQEAPKVEELMASRKENQNNQVETFINEENIYNKSEDYDLEDALISIKNLDYHLGKSVEDERAAQFELDSDTEYILNTSNLISQEDLDKIINNIDNLLQCDLEKELDESVQGMSFVFVVLAEAISQFDTKGDRSALSSSTWAIIFFLMILALGFDSQFGNMEGLISSLLDLNIFSQLNRQYLTGIICASSLIISLFAFAHSAGSYIFAIFDEFASNFSLVLIALFELLAISYIYGLKRFHDDCELMTGKRPNFTILLSWRYISPILLLVVLLATIKQYSVELNYKVWLDAHTELREWPNWCIALGSILIICCTIWIPLIMLLSVLKIKLLPEEELNRRWFPADDLREYHGIQEEGTRQFSRYERVLFGFSNDDD